MHQIMDTYMQADFLDHITDLVHGISADGHFFYANRSWKTTLQYDDDDLSTLTVLDIIHPDERESASAEFQKLRADEIESFESRCISKNGTERFVQWRAIVPSDEGSYYIIGCDITDERRAELERNLIEETLREKTALTQAIVDTAVDAIITIDTTGIIQSVNFATEELFGYAADEMVGQNIKMLMPSPHREHHDEYLTRYLQTGERRIIGIGRETVGVHKDGTAFPIYIAVSEVALNDRRLFTGIIQDITERKKIEAEREELINDLNAYAYTVAHDLKSPLNVVVGYANFMSIYNQELPAEKRAKYLAQIEQTALKMVEIINALLLLASVRRVDQVEIIPLDMTLILNTACERLAPDIHLYDANLVLPASLPNALGYAQWVEEIWINYLSNALKYGGQSPDVEVGADQLDNGMIRYWVRDNGNGLTPEAQQRLFKPFTRLQPGAEGHGIGLSIVKQIVEKLGGEVGVDSEVDQGSIFSFSLPQIDA